MHPVPSIPAPISTAAVEALRRACDNHDEELFEASLAYAASRGWVTIIPDPGGDRGADRIVPGPNRPS